MRQTLIVAQGHWVLCTSAYAFEKAQRDLEAKFPGALPILAALRVHFEIAAESRAHPCPEVLPAKDCSIYLAAHGCQATHLLTGDIKDFGPLMNQTKRTDGLVIQTAAQFLDSL